MIYALAQVGITGVPHRATLQWEQAASWGGVRIPASAGLAALQPGDLVFFSDDGTYFPTSASTPAMAACSTPPAPTPPWATTPLRDNYHGAVRFGELRRIERRQI